MKLVYIYIDFTVGGSNPEGYRNYKKCSLNLGTDYYFEMSEPTEHTPNYELKCTPRPVGERIEPGFWGDERLCNITALVGDNGVGKSTIIHEIIRCLLSDSLKANDRNSLFAILYQDINGEYHLHHSLSRPIKVSKAVADEASFDAGLQQLITEEKPFPPSAYVSIESRQEDQVQIHHPIKKTKLIYFSNALTSSDKHLFETFANYDHDLYYGQNESWNPVYTRPFYNCSLVSDMAEAMKTSMVSRDTISEHLETYFNFRSYQEARYVFDRNQRKLLSELKDTYKFPVPLPSSLTLRVAPALPHIKSLYVNNEQQPRTNDKKIFDDFCSGYENHFRFASDTDVLITALCLNCIACFGEYIAALWGKKYIQPDPPKATLCNRDWCIDFLNLLLPKKEKMPSEVLIDTKEYFDICLNYISLLWNNHDNIAKHFQNIEKQRDSNGEYFVKCIIPLGKEIHPVLTELMIRFINLTRAVSKMSYFVIYNWGLSSGESNLLHMFTKLRYLLMGSVYDKNTSPDIITGEIAKAAPLAERKESLINHIAQEGDTTCDSVILFLDEADLTLHPDWQRQFVAILVTFLSKIFLNPYHEGSSSGCKNIQIILGTHSPIMLGDFPAASVVYLLKNEDNTIFVNDRSSLQTFGQNIYTILQSGFYLENGTIGELARRKIQSLLDDTKDILAGEWNDSHLAHKWMDRLDNHLKLTVQYLPDGIIKNKLTEEIHICKNRLKDYLQPKDNEVISADENAAQIKKLEQENAELRRQLTLLRDKEGAE